MILNEKTIVSTTTLIASLTSYFYAKKAGKDTLPYMMIGGFVGAIIGEAITKVIIKDKDKDQNNNLKP